MKFCFLHYLQCYDNSGLMSSPEHCWPCALHTRTLMQGQSQLIQQPEQGLISRRVGRSLFSERQKLPIPGSIFHNRQESMPELAQYKYQC